MNENPKWQDEKSQHKKVIKFIYKRMYTASPLKFGEIDIIQKCHWTSNVLFKAINHKTNKFWTIQVNKKDAMPGILVG